MLCDVLNYMRSSDHISPENNMNILIKRCFKSKNKQKFYKHDWFSNYVVTIVRNALGLINTSLLRNIFWSIEYVS